MERSRRLQVEARVVALRQLVRLVKTEPGALVLAECARIWEPAPTVEREAVAAWDWSGDLVVEV